MRLGRVSFTNCLPVFHAMESNMVKSGIQLIAEPPTALNSLFARGELEITAVSSIAYAGMADNCYLLPDISIASDGAVQSVLLLSKVPVEQLEGEAIMITTDSATSIALLSILLQAHYRINAKLVPSPDSPEVMLASAPAALVIGDNALRCFYSGSSLRIYDLGQEWKEFSGEKMVYAGWVVRRSTVASRPEDVRYVWRILQQSKSYGLAHPREIAVRGAELTGLDSNNMLSYYRHLSYDLGDDYLQGLSSFFLHAYQLGLVNKLVRPQIWREAADATANHQQDYRNSAFNIR